MSSSRGLLNKGKTRVKHEYDAMELDEVRVRGSGKNAREKDEPPEILPSNTKRAAGRFTEDQDQGEEGEVSEPEGSNAQENDEEGGEEDNDEAEDNNEDDSFGKRKADEFLRRQGFAMDARFKSSVVLPGDDVTQQSTRATKSLKLGPGLLQRGEKILATRAGMLRYRPPCTFWIESNGRRYAARAEDQVLGIVEDRSGDSYKVNIFGSCSALLGMLEFDGASKRSKPNLKNGALVFCRVAVADKDMETELTCTSSHHGTRKEWMTGQATFGELHSGRMERCSLMLARALTKPNCRVLHGLAKHMPFEIATGLNGAFWVDSGCEENTIVICNAILNSEVMTDAQTDAMVDRLANHVKKELAD